MQQHIPLFHGLYTALRLRRTGAGQSLWPPFASGRCILLQESPLAGYQYHRAAGVWPFLRVGETLQLRREPANPHDTNAIGVWFRNDRLGYVPRRENRTLAQMLDRGERLEAEIVRLLDDDNPWRRIRIRIVLRPAVY